MTTSLDPRPRDQGEAPVHREPPPGDARRTGLAVVGLALLLAGMLALFAYPASRTSPRDLPLAMAGPAPALDRAEAALNQAQPGAFDVHRESSRQHAVTAIEHRKVYGALVFSGAGVEVLTASAASPVVAQLLGQVGSTMGSRSGQPVTHTDVVALPKDDPRGSGLSAAMLPIILGGMACAAVMTGLVWQRRWRIAGALGFAVVGGLALGAVLEFVIGSVEGNYLADSAALGLATAAVSLTVLGLESLLGTAGLGLGAAVMILVGNALSGAQSAPEMLPTGWGAAGQFLPPGAANQLLKSVAYFDGHGGLRPAIVLASWSVAGLLLSALGHARRRRDVSE